MTALRIVTVSIVATVKLGWTEDWEPPSVVARVRGSVSQTRTTVRLSLHLRPSPLGVKTHGDSRDSSAVWRAGWGTAGASRPACPPRSAPRLGLEDSPLSPPCVCVPCLGLAPSPNPGVGTRPKCDNELSTHLTRGDSFRDEREAQTCQVRTNLRTFA